MNKLIRFAGAAAALLLHLFISNPATALERAECKQYGGTADCWQPVIGRWKYDICEEGPATGPSQAKCRAQGGTWNGFDCIGLPPPELWRPTTEGDIVPLAKDEFTYFFEPLCAGPDATPYTWGVSIFSNFCSTAGSGPIFVQGHEQHNNTNFFVISGKRLSGDVCSTTDTTLTYSASRDRLVDCPSLGDQSYLFTAGGTPALCSLGFRIPINPKQPCDACTQVGNPIDPISGVKQQVDVDYAASGPHPLRFERTYNSRVYVVDGKHWRHGYSARIEYQNFGTRPVALAHRPRGQIFQFALTGGEFLPDVDINDRLTPLTDGGGNLTGWRYYEAASDAIETYDSTGKLLSITSRAGLTQALEYSSAATPVSVAPEPGLLIRVTDAFGRQLNFTYDAIARMVTMQDPAGQSYLYAYNAGNLITSVTYPDGKKRTYVYGEQTAAHRLTGLIDENNSRFASFFYDNFSGGPANRSQHAGNVDTVTIEYGAWPNTIFVTDARGTVRTHTFESRNGVYLNTGITQPAASGTGTVTSATTYDTNGNIATRRDFNGNRTNYVYDLARNLETSRTEGLTSAGATTSATRTIETQWHATFRLPTQITEKDGAGAVLRTTAFTHDANGNVLTRTVTAGSNSRTWTYTYNANGFVLTINGPRTDVSDVTTYTYYPNDATCPGAAPLGCRGQVETITNAAGHVTQITAYNAHGQPLSITDPNGLVTTLAYDLRQRLTSRNVGGEITSYDYDAVGQLTKVTLPDGSFLFYTYDAAHRLKEIADNLGNRIVYTLDAMGNRTLEQVRDPANALAQTRSRVYDSLNRLFQEIGAQSQTTQYGYDNQGNLTSIDGPLTGTGDRTANEYDPLNRLFRMTQPGGGQVTYGYNALDQLGSVTDPRSLATIYTINGLGNLDQQTSPDTGTTVSTYDAAGNLLTQTDARGVIATYSYDSLNRVTQIAYSGGGVTPRTLSYTYDQGAFGKGRLSALAHSVGLASGWTYDQHGRVTQRTETIGNGALTTGYAYEAGTGRLASMTYPAGGTLLYSYDGNGRVSAITSPGGTPGLSGVTYHPFGPVKGWT